MTGSPAQIEVLEADALAVTPPELGASIWDVDSEQELIRSCTTML